jgi:hypothetical protein
MSTLTPAQITMFLSTSNKRGKFKPVVKNFFESGEMYWDITDGETFPQFVTNNDGEKYTVNALKTSFKQNIDKLAADDAKYAIVKVVDNGNGGVYLVNETVTMLALKKQQDDAANENDDETDEDEDEDATV